MHIGLLRSAGFLVRQALPAVAFVLVAASVEAGSSGELSQREDHFGV